MKKEEQELEKDFLVKTKTLLASYLIFRLEYDFFHSKDNSLYEKSIKIIFPILILIEKNDHIKKTLLNFLYNELKNSDFCYFSEKKDFLLSYESLFSPNDLVFPYKGEIHFGRDSYEKLEFLIDKYYKNFNKILNIKNKNIDEEKINFLIFNINQFIINNFLIDLKNII